MARPSKYSQKLALLICERLVNGESLRGICETEGIPDRGTIFRWLEQHPEFHSQYARAREMQAESFADELTEIADDARNDWMERRNSEGVCVGWQENGEAIGRSRVRIDTRKWIASKLKPKKYGDKLELAGDADSPLTIKIVQFGKV